MAISSCSARYCSNELSRACLFASPPALWRRGKSMIEMVEVVEVLTSMSSRTSELGKGAESPLALQLGSRGAGSWRNRSFVSWMSCLSGVNVAGTTGTSALGREALEILDPIVEEIIGSNGVECYRITHLIWHEMRK
jgi:hypothetical protein